MTRQHIQAPAFQAQQAMRLAQEIPDIEAAALPGLKQHLGHSRAPVVRAKAI